MTRIEYELLRKERPEFKLWAWDRLGWRGGHDLIKALTYQQLVAMCTAQILAGEMKPSGIAICE